MSAVNANWVFEKVILFLFRFSLTKVFFFFFINIVNIMFNCLFDFAML